MVPRIFQFYKFYLIVLLPLISCEYSRDDTLIEKLQGDWLYHNSNDNMSFISFKDSLFFDGERYNEFKPFTVKKDSIFIPSYEMKFKITKVTKKHIWSKVDEHEIPFFISTDVFSDSSLKLLSLEVRFVYFDNIGLLDWALYIDHNLNCFIKIERKKEYTHVENPSPYSKGVYYYKLSKAEFDFYQNKFRNIPISKVNGEYISDDFSINSTCFPSDRTVVKFNSYYRYKNNKKIRQLSFITKGYKEVPNYLRAFIIHLNKIHRFLEFKKSTVEHHFELYNKDEKYYF